MSDPLDHVTDKHGKRVLTPGKCRPAKIKGQKAAMVEKPNPGTKPVLRNHPEFSEIEALIRDMLGAHQLYIDAPTLDNGGILSVLECNTRTLSRATRALKEARRSKTFEEQSSWIISAHKILHL